MSSPAISNERYVLFTTFKRDGSPVNTAVWIAPFGAGQACFTTGGDSAKVKRLRNNPRVTLQKCDCSRRYRCGLRASERRHEKEVRDPVPTSDVVERNHVAHQATDRGRCGRHHRLRLNSASSRHPYARAASSAVMRCNRATSSIVNVDDG
jgi:hypothetical protein